MGFFDNCKPQERFGAYNSTYYPRGPSTWYTIDWDQRKSISARVPEDVSGMDDEEVDERIKGALAACVDQLDPSVHLVNFSMEGEFISASSDDEDDFSFSPVYNPIEFIPESLRPGTVSRDELIEVDRLAPCVDLVSYRSRPGSRAVFKYHIHSNQALKIWHELNCWLRLSGHPNIVPLESIVTEWEEVPGHGIIEVAVGFTSKYIPGMTLQDNIRRPFRLKHLRELFQVVDDLNLKFGILHRDILPQNLLIDPDTDTLQMIDFGVAGKLGWPGGSDGSNFFVHRGDFRTDLEGVEATVYEIITRDNELAVQVHMGDKKVSAIQERDWVKHPDVNLDADVSAYRAMIQSWLERRKQPENVITHYTQAPNPLEWPQSWRPIISWPDDEGKAAVGERFPSLSMSWAQIRALGLKGVEWERPAHNKIPEGFCVLGSGKLVAKADLLGAGVSFESTSREEGGGGVIEDGRSIGRGVTSC